MSRRQGRQLTDLEIRKLIANVENFKLDILVKTINVLRPQKTVLPEIELKFLEACENEIKRRNSK